MIVISSDLVLSAVDIVQGTPWIGYQTLVTPGSLDINLATQAPGKPLANLANPATHLVWSSTSLTGTEYFHVQGITTLDPIDYLAVAKHNFGSTGKQLFVFGQATPGGPTISLAGPQILPDDSPVMFRWTPQVLSDVYLQILDVGAGGIVPPTAAVLYVGRLLVMERGLDIKNDHVPVKFGRHATVVSGMSESGNFLGRIVTGEWRESKAEFAHITPTFYRAWVDPFIAASKLAPFFFAWAPLEYPGECGYCWMTNEPQPETSTITRRVALELQMRGVA